MTGKATLLTLDAWFRRAPGAMLVASERAQLARLLPHLPGDTLVQIGGPSDLTPVSSSTIACRVYISPCQVTGPRSGLSLQMDLKQLPLQRECCDGVVLMHGLEFVDDSDAVLAAVARSLKPGGHLLLFGFNRCSLWSLYGLFKETSFLAPWRAHTHSMLSVRRRLIQHRYSLVSCNSVCFVPPLSRRLSLRWQWYWEAFGRLCAPGFGAAYFIHAQKRVRSGTPLLDLEAVSPPALIKPGYAEPTTRAVTDVRKS